MGICLSAQTETYMRQENTSVLQFSCPLRIGVWFCYHRKTDDMEKDGIKKLSDKQILVLLWDSFKKISFSFHQECIVEVINIFHTKYCCSLLWWGENGTSGDLIKGVWFQVLHFQLLFSCTGILHREGGQRVANANSFAARPRGALGKHCSMQEAPLAHR